MDFNEMGKKKGTNKERKARKEEQMKISDIYQKNKKKFFFSDKGGKQENNVPLDLRTKRAPASSSCF